MSGGHPHAAEPSSVRDRTRRVVGTGAHVAGGFDVVVDGTVGPAVLCRLRDTFGEQHLLQGDGALRIELADQAAMIGALLHLHDLGLEIALVQRRSPERSAFEATGDHRVSERERRGPG